MPQTQEELQKILSEEFKAILADPANGIPTAPFNGNAYSAVAKPFTKFLFDPARIKEEKAAETVASENANKDVDGETTSVSVDEGEFLEKK